MSEESALPPGLTPLWSADATGAGQKAWARFTRDAWAQGTFSAFVILGGDRTLLGACSLEGG